MLIVVNRLNKSKDKSTAYEVYCPKHVEKIKLNIGDEILDHNITLTEKLLPFKVELSQFSQSSNNTNLSKSKSIDNESAEKVIDLLNSPEIIQNFLLSQVNKRESNLKRLKKTKDISKRTKNIIDNSNQLERVSNLKNYLESKLISKKTKKKKKISRYFDDESSRIYGYNSEGDDGNSDANSFQNSDSQDNHSDDDSVLSGNFINDGNYTQHEVANDDSLFYMRQNNKRFNDSSPLNIKKQFLEAKILLRRSKENVNNNKKVNKYGFEILPDTQIEDIKNYSSSELDDSFIVYSSDNEIKLNSSSDSQENQGNIIKEHETFKSNPNSYKNSSNNNNYFCPANPSNLIPVNLLDKFTTKHSINTFKYTLDTQESVSQYSNNLKNSSINNINHNNSTFNSNTNHIYKSSSHGKYKNNNESSFTKASTYLSELNNNN